MPNYLLFFVIVLHEKKEDNTKKMSSLSCNYENEIAMNLPVSFIYGKSIRSILNY